MTVDEIVKAILALTEEGRLDVKSGIGRQDSICSTCWSDKTDRRCWACYESQYDLEPIE